MFRCFPIRMAKKYQKVLATSLILLTWSTGRDRDTSSLGWFFFLLDVRVSIPSSLPVWFEALLSLTLTFTQAWNRSDTMVSDEWGGIWQWWGLQWEGVFFRSQSIYVTIRYNHNPIYLFIFNYHHLKDVTPCAWFSFLFYQQLVLRTNSNLANGMGNLVQRTLRSIFIDCIISWVSP